MPHHLIDDPTRDAGVLQPGRVGVAEVVGTVQVDRFQQVSRAANAPAVDRDLAGQDWSPSPQLVAR
jgi:hypothetical protein